ncbi:MICOS complex subunit MIC60 isoform X2 [Jatropha curcas]|uniref:MICOS complex subunit MIC60 isoform X2 n=1 Tax=Jatropha curcas TaxID=180498 RepID=UPI0018957814|nr:MICOS complex subunit MIC60 isoform X2 [Jatropha curcas]XP_037497711.1 MICOS complex subunit MIC60 isoform X2 [Jatropha curcas]
MSEAGPKLYANKPKKAQLKQFQEQLKAKDFSSPTPTQTPYASASSAAAESYRMGSQSTAPPPPPPPPQPPKESFARRYKFLWPLILTVNLTVGEVNGRKMFGL